MSTIGEQSAKEALQEAIHDIKILGGLLPICANCKSIRDDKGYWKELETYLHDHSEAHFTHGICPSCVSKLYPDHAHGTDDQST